MADFDLLRELTFRRTILKRPKTIFFIGVFQGLSPGDWVDKGEALSFNLAPILDPPDELLQRLAIPNGNVRRYWSRKDDDESVVFCVGVLPEENSAILESYYHGGGMLCASWSQSRWHWKNGQWTAGRCLQAWEA